MKSIYDIYYRLYKLTGDASGYLVLPAESEGEAIHAALVEILRQAGIGDILAHSFIDGVSKFIYVSNPGKEFTIPVGTLSVSKANFLVKKLTLSSFFEKGVVELYDRRTKRTVVAAKPTVEAPEES